MVFKSFDKDNDGSIDTNELKTAMQRLGLTKDDKVIQQLIKDVDTNKNGKIEFDEFINVNKYLNIDGKRFKRRKG
jgi:Ca2+-binding EF-hand superfamily protein